MGGGVGGALLPERPKVPKVRMADEDNLSALLDWRTMGGREDEKSWSELLCWIPRPTEPTPEMEADEAMR